MISLEKLILNFTVTNRSTFIDGNHFQNEILLHMPRLQSFAFDIVTYINFGQEVNIQSNDDIQNTFLNKRYGQVTCCLEYFANTKANCHIYSLPFTMDGIHRIIVSMQICFICH